MFGCGCTLCRALPAGCLFRVEDHRVPVEGRNAQTIADFRICERMDWVRKNARFGVEAFSGISMILDVCGEGDGA